MIQRVFSPENGFMPVLYKISNLFLLNILWILFSLPILTVGASTAALYTVTLKMCRNKESYICRSFVQAFRKNFRQGTLIWLAYAGVGGILYFNLYAAATGKLFAQAFFLTVFTVMSILYVMIGIYLAPVLAKFDTTIIQILKISIFLCFRHIIRTILMMIVILIPYLAVAIDLYLLPVLIIIAVSGTAYISACILNRIFSKYIQEVET